MKCLLPIMTGNETFDGNENAYEQPILRLVYSPPNSQYQLINSQSQNLNTYHSALPLKL